MTKKDKLRIFHQYNLQEMQPLCGVGAFRSWGYSEVARYIPSRADVGFWGQFRPTYLSSTLIMEDQQK